LLSLIRVTSFRVTFCNCKIPDMTDRPVFSFRLCVLGVYLPVQITNRYLGIDTPGSTLRTNSFHRRAAT
jgi:hypothetical protein